MNTLRLVVVLALVLSAQASIIRGPGLSQDVSNVVQQPKQEEAQLLNEKEKKPVQSQEAVAPVQQENTKPVQSQVSKEGVAAVQQEQPKPVQSKVSQEGVAAVQQDHPTIVQSQVPKEEVSAVQQNHPTIVQSQLPTEGVQQDHPTIVQSQVPEEGVDALQQEQSKPVQSQAPKEGVAAVQQEQPKPVQFLVPKEAIPAVPTFAAIEQPEGTPVVNKEVQTAEELQPEVAVKLEGTNNQVVDKVQPEGRTKFVAAGGSNYANYPDEFYIVDKDPVAASSSSSSPQVASTPNPTNNTHIHTHAHDHHYVYVKPSLFPLPPPIFGSFVPPGISGSGSKYGSSSSSSGSKYGSSGSSSGSKYGSSSSSSGSKYGSSGSSSGSKYGSSGSSSGSKYGSSGSGSGSIYFSKPSFSYNYNPSVNNNGGSTNQAYYQVKPGFFTLPLLPIPFWKPEATSDTNTENVTYYNEDYYNYKPYYYNEPAEFYINERRAPEDQSMGNKPGLQLIGHIYIYKTPENAGSSKPAVPTATDGDKQNDSVGSESATKIDEQFANSQLLLQPVVYPPVNKEEQPEVPFNPNQINEIYRSLHVVHPSVQQRSKSAVAAEDSAVLFAVEIPKPIYRFFKSVLGVFSY